MVMHRIGEIVMLAPGERYIGARRRSETGTPGQYVQNVGRGVRAGEAKAPSVVMDFGGTHRTFCDEQAAVLERIGVAPSDGRGCGHSLNDGWRDTAARDAERIVRDGKREAVRCMLDAAGECKAFPALAAGVVVSALCVLGAVYAGQIIAEVLF